VGDAHCGPSLNYSAVRFCCATSRAVRSHPRHGVALHATMHMMRLHRSHVSASMIARPHGMLPAGWLSIVRRLNASVSTCHGNSNRLQTMDKSPRVRVAIGLASGALCGSCESVRGGGERQTHSLRGTFGSSQEVRHTGQDVRIGLRRSSRGMISDQNYKVSWQVRERSLEQRVLCSVHAAATQHPQIHRYRRANQAHALQSLH